jgi:hypothetical protein
MDAQVWETVRTFEPVMSAAMKKISDLAETVKILQEQCAQHQNAHERTQADLHTLTQDYAELKGQDDIKRVEIEELKTQVERLEARVLQVPAEQAQGYSMPDELDEVVSVAKTERSGCDSETVQRQWKAQILASPPPLPHDLGRTPPCSPREAGEAKTAGQENGPANVEVKKRVAGHIRSHHKQIGPTIQWHLDPSSTWLRQNFGGNAVAR